MQLVAFEQTKCVSTKDNKMNMNLYVVNDLVAGESGPVFEAKNDLVAMRNVKNMMSNVNPSYYSDYKLLCVGVVDHETNEVTPKSYEISIEFADAMANTMEKIGVENE